MINLTSFTGTEQYYQLEVFSGNVVTEGVLTLAKKANAHWLATDILINQKYIEEVRTEPFISWKLKKQGKDKALLIADDGNENILYSKEYCICDFPFEKIQSSLSTANEFVMFFASKVLMLPSEY